MTRILLPLFLCISALLPSCTILYPEQWTAQEIPMCSSIRLWEITRLAMEKNGFPIVKAGFDPKTNMTVSGWERQMHPFKGNGIRERVHVRYRRSENAGKLVIGVRVEQEINDNLARPLDPEYADWIEADDNPGRAKVILQYLRSTLGQELEIGKTVDRDELEEDDNW